MSVCLYVCVYCSSFVYLFACNSPPNFFFVVVFYLFFPFPPFFSKNKGVELGYFEGGKHLENVVGGEISY